MTLRRFPSAVYHCDLPVGAIYSSSLNARGRCRTPASKPPIAAWPEINKIDDWCSFPGLFRAIYIYVKDQVKENNPDFQFILKHSDVIAHKMLNEAKKLCQADYKYQQINLLLSSQWFELCLPSRGIYNIYDIYSQLHETCHGLVGIMGLYIALQQSAYSAVVRDVLKLIWNAPQLSLNEIRHLWQVFFAANKNLWSSVQKCRAAEETVANIYALTITSTIPEIRDEICDRLDKSMYEHGYEPFANAFTEGCKGRYQLALPLMELFTILLLECKLSQKEALHTSIAALESLSAKHSVPSLEDVDQWAISAYPNLEPTLSEILELRKELHSVEDWYPLTLLWGMGNHTEIMFAKGEEITIDYLASESIRQQISLLCGLTCLYRRENEPCCGGQDYMWTLWERLPKNYQSVLRPPTCTRA